MLAFVMDGMHSIHLEMIGYEWNEGRGRKVDK